MQLMYRLADVPLAPVVAPLPADVRRFLREADRRIDAFQQAGRVTGFVPSDYVAAYGMLRAVVDGSVARGPRFCEWGSGFGVVAALAAMLEFDSYGIEIEGDLVIAARQLADDFEVAVEFAHGSFVPRGGERHLHAAGDYSWLNTDGDYTYDDLGLDPADFDVIFAYPWPDEEAATDDLFGRYAGTGAVLVSYHGGDDIRVRRKVGRRSGK